MEIPPSPTAEPVLEQPTGERRQLTTRAPVVVAGPLDRAFDLSRISVYAVVLTIIMVVGVVLRLVHLSRFALDTAESRLAFDGWSLYTGNALDPGQHQPVTQPLITLLEAFSFFLFSSGDVSARVAPVVASIAMFPLIAMLRPVVGRPAVIGMSLLVAISPTIVYTSRLINSNILLAVSAMILVVAVARAGVAGVDGRDLRRWGLMAGIGIGLLLASGPGLDQRPHQPGDRPRRLGGTRPAPRDGSRRRQRRTRRAADPAECDRHQRDRARYPHAAHIAEQCHGTRRRRRCHPADPVQPRLQ